MGTRDAKPIGPEFHTDYIQPLSYPEATLVAPKLRWMGSELHLPGIRVDSTFWDKAF